MNPLLDLAAAFDAAILLDRLGMDADPWQQQLLRSESERILLLASRQVGKSSVTALKVLHTLLYCHGSLSIMVSPSQRQSSEIFRKVLAAWKELGCPVPAEQLTALTLTLANGSRCVSLPGNEQTIRGFSAPRLVVIDEGARVEDELFNSVLPMLATSKGGQLIALSSAFAKKGWFYSEWSGSGPWHRIKVPATACKRISPAFLREQRRLMGPRWYAMEFACEFQAAVDSVFPPEDIEAALRPGAAPALAFPE